MEKGWKLIRKGGKLEMEAGKRSKKRWGVYQNGNFLPGKSISRGKKIRKNDLAPSEKYACYVPAWKLYLHKI